MNVIDCCLLMNCCCAKCSKRTVTQWFMLYPVYCHYCVYWLCISCLMFFCSRCPPPRAQPFVKVGEGHVSLAPRSRRLWLYCCFTMYFWWSILIASAVAWPICYSLLFIFMYFLFYFNIFFFPVFPVMLHYSYTQTFSLSLLYCCYSYCVLFCALLDSVCLSRNKMITYLLELLPSSYCDIDPCAGAASRRAEILCHAPRRRPIFVAQPNSSRKWKFYQAAEYFSALTEI